MSLPNPRTEAPQPIAAPSPAEVRMMRCKHGNNNPCNSFEEFDSDNVSCPTQLWRNNLNNHAHGRMSVFKIHTHVEKTRNYNQPPEEPPHDLSLL